MEFPEPDVLAPIELCPLMLPDCELGLLLVLEDGLVEDWLLVEGLLEDWLPMVELLLELLDGVVELWLDWLLVEGELCVAWLLLLLAGAL